MRLMSFAATVEQMRARTKTVTRRLDRKGYWQWFVDEKPGGGANKPADLNF